MSMKHCIKCGKELEDSSTFCSKCGSKQETDIERIKYYYFATSSLVSGFIALILCFLTFILMFGVRDKVWGFLLLSGFVSISLGIFTMIIGFIGGTIGKEKLGNIGFLFGLFSTFLSSIFTLVFWL